MIQAPKGNMIELVLKYPVVFKGRMRRYLHNKFRVSSCEFRVDDFQSFDSTRYNIINQYGKYLLSRLDPDFFAIRKGIQKGSDFALTIHQRSVEIDNLLQSKDKRNSDVSIQKLIDRLGAETTEQRCCLIIRIG